MIFLAVRGALIAAVAESVKEKIPGIGATFQQPAMIVVFSQSRRTPRVRQRSSVLFSWCRPARCILNPLKTLRSTEKSCC